MRQSSVLLLLAAFAAIVSPTALAQRVDKDGASQASAAKPPEVYPTGDAVGVYRAVLDLLYIDGKERPDVILLSDTARRQSGGPCPRKCKEVWPHKSKIDSATIREYARPSLGTPRIVPFPYKIPIKLVNTHDFERWSHEGVGLLATLPQDRIGPAERVWTGFTHRFPGAWGWVMLGTVAFDEKHTEALIGVRQACGPNCYAFETIYLRRIGGHWKVIERIPEQVEVSPFPSGFMNPVAKLRYRGPAGIAAHQSQMVALDAGGTPPRPESDDAVKVYHAVLDRLYAFHGERPGTLVITDDHMRAPQGVPKHQSRIDSITVANYDFYTQVSDGVNRFRYRLPIGWVSHDYLEQLERDGAQLAKAAAARMEMEQSPIWLAFHSRHPAAWGLLSLGRVAFNPRHTQALVFTRHLCGSSCINTDTWFLERKNESWHIVERMPRDNQSGWGIDGLRYLGPDADPKAYRRRRVQGTIVDAATRLPLAITKVEATHQTNQSRSVTTDSAGRYVLNDLPLGMFLMKIACRNGSPSDSLHLGVISVTPGLDSTVNFSAEFVHCPLREPQLAPNAPQDSPVAAAQKCVMDAIEAAIQPYTAQARASWPRARERYLAGLPKGHTFFVTALLTDQTGRREQVFVAVESIRAGAITGRIWSSIAVVRGYHHGDRYTFPEAELRDWTISRPDGTEEGNFVGKFLDTYEPPRSCVPVNISG